MSFDFDDLGIEEIERRLELAIGMLPIDALGCGTYDGSCGANNRNTFPGNCGSSGCATNTEVY
jgi:hypothetical protein